MDALYICDGAALGVGDFTRALREAGVREGETVFVHSDIGVFGKLAATSEAVYRGLVEALLESVGPRGTVVMPTFSYTLRKGETFDPEHTPSTVGALTNYFRTYPDVRRSTHPVFSVAALGPEAERYLDTSDDCFGPGTVFDTLVRENARIVMFGATFQACSLAHHIEQMAAVPYRYEKTFTVAVLNAGEQAHKDVRYFVRPLDGDVELSLAKFEDELRARDIISKARIGRGAIVTGLAKPIYDAGMELAAKDPYIFLDHPPKRAGTRD